MEKNFAIDPTKTYTQTEIDAAGLKNWRGRIDQYGDAEFVMVQNIGATAITAGLQAACLTTDVANRYVRLATAAVAQQWAGARVLLADSLTQNLWGLIQISGQIPAIPSAAGVTAEAQVTLSSETAGRVMDSAADYLGAKWAIGIAQETKATGVAAVINAFGRSVYK